METTEHIAEEYVRHKLKWFTNPNIKAKGGKEIDILAIDKKGRRYWIECGVTHKINWALKSKADRKDFQVLKREKSNKKIWRHRNSVDYFISHKFNDPKLKEKLKDFGFKKGNYKKIIVCWQTKTESVKKYSKRKGIYEVWELKNKMKDLMSDLGETYYSDDILRTLQLAHKVK